MSETPAISAIKLLNQYGIEDPTQVAIEELMWAQGGIYQEKHMTGAEGRIIFAGEKSAIIVVNKTIKNPEKLRFVRAHELGHLRMHRSLRPFFNCDVAAFMERNKQGSHEAEANSFAAELLMPERLFNPLVCDEAFNVNIVKKLGNRFQTSLMATAFRYAELGAEPIAFFFCKNDHIEWAHRSESFIATYLPTKKPLPVQSITHRYFVGGITPSDPELVMGNVWFNSRRIPNELLFYEQCIPIPSINGALTFVWMSNQYK